MDSQFIFLPAVLLNQQTTVMLRACNDYTSQFGLQLSEEEIQQLIENRREVLGSTGRIEFGVGVIQKIVMEFADSAYMNYQDYVNVLMELQECFYYFKKEAMEELTDDELIRIMKLYFEDVCQGDVELLQTTMLENYCRDIRYGTKEYRNLNGYDDEYSDFLDWDEKE